MEKTVATLSEAKHYAKKGEMCSAIESLESQSSDEEDLANIFSNNESPTPPQLPQNSGHGEKDNEVEHDKVTKRQKKIEKKMYKMFEELKEQQREILTAVGNIERVLKAKNIQKLNEGHIFKFPLNTVDEVSTLEEQLKSPEVQQALVS